MAALQKLLWNAEYSDFVDEIVLVESRFVLEKKHGECLCMVHAGITRTIVLIAEESVGSGEQHHKTVVVSSEEESNVQYLHLAHLFPLENIKLSIRKHQEHQGEHVLRLRLSTGKTWYLELAGGRHREDKWREWLYWIHDLEERWQERREDGRGGRKISGPTTKPKHPEEIGGPMEKPRHDSNKITDLQGNGNEMALAAAQNRKRRDSRAYHWVGHFQGALSRDHDGQIATDDGHVPDMGLPGLNNSQHSQHSHITKSHGQMAPQPSLVWQQAGTHHALPAKQPSFSSTDTYSSIQDIESVGSLVGRTNMDWMQPLSEEINRKLLLCVADLFQKFNIEMHGHGHVGRWRPMASLTTLEQLKNLEHHVSKRTRSGLPSLPDTQKPHHCSSLPDVLDGDAGFLDDMHSAADAVHRESLVYMDLTNDDDAKTPHVIGGHVMLLSPEEVKLREDIARSREIPEDVEFDLALGADGKTTSERGSQRNKPDHADTSDIMEVHKKMRPRKERRKSIGESLKAKLHLGSNGHKISKPVKKRHTKDDLDGKPNDYLSKRILRNIHSRKMARQKGQEDVLETPQPRISFCEIDPRALAEELTIIDSLLFVRVREAELVDCLWLKRDKHARAAHTTKLIKFLERVVGLVSTEILQLPTARARAEAMAKVVQVGEWCRRLQNFHSLMGVLSGLKVLPVYRLKETWRVFREDFLAEFETWNELACLVADTTKGGSHSTVVGDSLRSPPCLPFFGTFLQSVLDLYSAVDRAGMRNKSHGRRTRPSSSSSSSWSSASSSCLVPTSDSEQELNTNHDFSNAMQTSRFRIQSRPGNQAGFFNLFAAAWLSFRHKQETSPAGTGVTYARKAHIRTLIIAYAKQCAEQRGQAWLAESSTTTQDMTGGDLIDGVDGSIDWRSLFEKVQPSKKPATAVLEEEERDERKKAEYRLFETLFTHQMAAVQYEFTSNMVVRDYLLHAPYNTDERNYRLSLSREPPSD